jgi:dipeptidyl aminopeptidase/acylaminoacyl peptidase
MASFRFIFLLFLISISQSLSGTVPKKYPYRDFLYTPTFKGGDIAFDSSQAVLSSDQSGVFNIFTVPATGGKLTQLTDSKVDGYNAESFFPKDYRILFSHDEGGNEIFHQYVLEMNRRIVPLQKDKNERSILLNWSQDGSGYYYLSNLRDPAQEDLMKMDATTYRSSLIWENPGFKMILAVSPDERYIALNENVGIDGEHLSVYDLKEKKIIEFTDKNPEVNEIPFQFSKDGEWLYYFTNRDSEFSYIRRHHLPSGKDEIVLQVNFDILTAYLSKNNTYFVATINENGLYKTRVYNQVEKKEVPLPIPKDLTVAGSSISADEKAILLQLEGQIAPLDYYAYFFKEEKLYQLTQALHPNINPSDLVIPEQVSFPSFDGLSIPALYYKPKGIKAGEKVPALVMVHGGPRDQYRTRWYPTTQYLVNQGYAVLAVNYRGSVGYGKTFKRGAQGSQGVSDLKDAIAAKKYLASRNEVNPDKIGIQGGSYGGYLTLAALAFYPNEFAVGVDLFGPSNWVRTVQNFPDWWTRGKERWYKRFGVTSKESAEEKLRSISPLFHAKNIKAPLFVLQGKNDPRVREEESDDIVNALKKNGVPVEYLLFENEGHGAMRIKKNQESLMESLTKFLDKYLKQ